MNNRKLDILLIAEAPPQVYLDENSTQKVFDWITFQVKVEQLKDKIPLYIYNDLLINGKVNANVLVVHGMESGGFSEYGRAAIRQFDPDMIVCCHPMDVRKLNLDLPIWGWTDKIVYINFDKDSRIVRIFEG